MKLSLAAPCIAALLFSANLAFTQETKQDPKPEKKDAAPADRTALEKQFAETLSNAVMVGSFTVTGRPEKKLNEEKYTLGKVSKLNGDVWLFNVRIQYGDKDATLPLPLEVKWAGDTPIISLTKAPIPGFGTFTARVVIYENHYAGFWSGGDHGGHLFGTIEKPKEVEKPKDVEKPKTEPQKK